MWHRAPANPDEREDAERLDAAPLDPPVDDVQMEPLSLDESASRQALEGALADLRSYPAGTSSAKRAIGPLLDLWDVAAAVDRSVARPVEQLLVTLVNRSVVSSDEIAECLDEVQRVADALSPQPVG